MADAKPSRIEKVPARAKPKREPSSPKEDAPSVSLLAGQELLKNERGQWVVRTRLSETAYAESIVTSIQD